MREILIRCSSLGKIMTEPKTKTEGILSVGAKTYIRELAQQEILGVEFSFSSKETEKGKTLHSVIESDYKTAKGHLIGEILENGTKNGRIQPRPYKEQTKAKAKTQLLQLIS